jgi:predicted ester cyclase
VLVEPRDLLQRATDLWNARDLKGYLDLHDEDCELVAPGFAGKGHDCVREWWAMWNTAFPDNRVSHQALVAEDDALVAESTFQGTHTGPLTTPDGGHIRPTGRQVTGEYATVHRIRGDLVHRSRIYFDRHDLLEQLGIARRT